MCSTSSTFSITIYTAVNFVFHQVQAANVGNELKHSCMSSSFPIAILHGTFVFRERNDLLGRRVSRLSKLTILIIIIIMETV